MLIASAHLLLTDWGDVCFPVRVSHYSLSSLVIHAVIRHAALFVFMQQFVQWLHETSVYEQLLKIVYFVCT